MPLRGSGRRQRPMPLRGRAHGHGHGGCSQAHGDRRRSGCWGSHEDRWGHWHWHVHELAQVRGDLADTCGFQCCDGRQCVSAIDVGDCGLIQTGYLCQPILRPAALLQKPTQSSQHIHARTTLYWKNRCCRFKRPEDRCPADPPPADPVHLQRRSWCRRSGRGGVPDPGFA